MGARIQGLVQYFSLHLTTDGYLSVHNISVDDISVTNRIYCDRVSVKGEKPSSMKKGGLAVGKKLLDCDGKCRSEDVLCADRARLAKHLAVETHLRCACVFRDEAPDTGVIGTAGIAEG